MTGFVDTTVNDIDGRLKELQAEVVKLEAARAALVGDSRPAPTRTVRTGPQLGSRANSRSTGTRSTGTRSTGSRATGSRSTGRRPGRPRGRRGGNTRSNQALELVRSKPGITIPQIAETLKIEPNYLYRVMPKLLSEGLVSREGQGWVPAGGAAS